MSKDVVSKKDSDLLEFTKNLIEYAGGKLAGDMPEWPIPKSAIERLSLAYADFEEKHGVFTRSLSRPDCVIKNESKKILRAEDRLFLNSYIREKDYVTEADRVSLGLPIRDKIFSVIGAPAITPSFDIVLLGEGRVKLSNIRPSRVPARDERAALYGITIRWGMMGPTGGRDKFRLIEAPASGEDLPHPDFTCEKNYVLDLNGESGNRVYIAMRYENRKGDKGPWGTLVTFFIP